MSRAHRKLLPDWPRRLGAAAGAVLVLALTVFSASPVAHRWLHAAAAPTADARCHHHHDHDGAPSARPDTPLPATDLDDHTCAVVLFAGGVDLPVAPFALTPPSLAPAGVSSVAAAELHLLSPRYLRQPERGPPASALS
jgi:hypothetical protein